jgi:hypothetical protein
MNCQVDFRSSGTEPQGTENSDTPYSGQTFDSWPFWSQSRLSLGTHIRQIPMHYPEQSIAIRNQMELCRRLTQHLCWLKTNIGFALGIGLIFCFYQKK